MHRAYDDHHKGLSPIIPGVECPDFHSIVFRKVGGPSSVSMDDHPPNKVFRSIIQDVVMHRCNQKKKGQVPSVLLGEAIDMPRAVVDVITEAKNMNYRFLTYDNKKGWYVDITYEIGNTFGINSILRSLVGQSINEQWKHYIKEQWKKSFNTAAATEPPTVLQQQRRRQRELLDDHCNNCYC